MTAAGHTVRSPLLGVLMLSAALAAIVIADRVPAGADSLPTSAVPSQDDEDHGSGVGEFLYGRDCAGCHGPDGEGSPRGVELTGSGEAGAYYMLVTGRMPISDPDDEPRRSASPYTDAQVAALVDHVAGFGEGPALPDIDDEGGDLASGGVLYRLHCAACHSATGIGGALASGEFAPSLMGAEPEIVGAAVTSGPGAMPSFAPVGFTEAELEGIVLYVQELRRTTDHGGWPVFRAGRVDEGMVAWFVGIPAMVLFSVWMARRAR